MDMIFKKNISNLVYVGLYILALVLFFFCEGNTGNNRVFFSAAHILCAAALAINTDRKIAAFFLKSLTIYLLLTNILWVANLPVLWSVLLFLGIGFSHIMLINDNDIFGHLASSNEQNSSDGLKILIWVLVSAVVFCLFIFI